MVFVLLISQGRKMCSWKKVLTCLNLALVNKNFHNRCDITVAATEQQKLFVRLEKMQNSLCLSSSTMSSVSFFYNLISWPRWPVLFNILLEKWRYYWLFSCFFNLFTIESFESFSLKLSNNISSFVFWVSDCCFKWGHGVKNRNCTNF